MLHLHRTATPYVSIVKVGIDLPWRLHVELSFISFIIKKYAGTGKQFRTCIPVYHVVCISPGTLNNCI